MRNSVMAMPLKTLERIYKRRVLLEPLMRKRARLEGKLKEVDAKIRMVESVRRTYRKRRKVSAKALANIRAGAKKRWAAFHAEKARKSA